jgi:Type I phosphodiesterase / nucleotide pyrophosphatase
MSRGPAADVVIFVLLDGCRPDYLGRTRFLRQLATRSLVGQLEEPFGFCPRGAYFGGLTMAEQGYTHLFRYDPARTVFSWTRDLAGGADDHVARALHPRIVQRARIGLSDFAAAAVNPWGIPLEWQRYFDFSEREAPWSPRAGYRSLFHVLDGAGLPWMELSWPFVGLPETVGDGVVAGDALRRLQADHRFAFVHLPALDALGHQYGPGSREVQAQLGGVDRLCELITHRALDLFDDPVLVFAGDHGMLPVVRHANPAARIEATGLRFGHDLAYFIDSTMVRCWYFTEAARRTVRAAFAGCEGGKWLDAPDRRRWQIDGIDARNGEDYFLADPGVVFSPSFFDWTGEHVPRGMHGYAPDAVDNRGLFLAHRPRLREQGQVGVVEARRLYPTFLEWLGWDAADFTDALPIVAPEPVTTSRWFTGLPAAADGIVDAHLAEAVSTIVQRAPAATSVLLTGGFGRGEGTPIPFGEQARPANDYDLVVLGADEHALDGLGDELAKAFSLDFVDVTAGRELRPPAPVKLGDFDLRYGGRVLWGDPAAVEQLGSLAPADLDIVEAVFLVGNRTGGLLLALTGEGPSKDDRGRFDERQVSKFFIAIADAWLIAIGDYAVSYALRQQRFASLARSAGFSDRTLRAVDRAYAAKLGHRDGDGSGEAHVDTAIGALRELDRVLGWNRDADARRATVRHAVARHLPYRESWASRVRTEAGPSDLARGGPDGPPSDGTDTSGAWPAIGAAVYEAVREIVLAWPLGVAARGAAARAALAGACPGVASLGDAEVARATARLWLGFFH